MNQLVLRYPAKPFHVNQTWGIYNPVYAKFGFSHHNGIDIALGTDHKLYAPCDGQVVRIGNQPEGGGNFFGIMTEPYQFSDGVFRVLIDFLHCESISVTEGQLLKMGDVMAIADNTGFSTGPHTHIQPRRVKSWNGKGGIELVWEPQDVNDMNGSFDPMPYFNGAYASDTAIQAVKDAVVSVQQAIDNHPSPQQLSLIQELVSKIVEMLSLI